MDGGLIDDNVVVLRAYDPWLTAWLCETNTGCRSDQQEASSTLL